MPSKTSIIVLPRGWVLIGEHDEYEEGRITRGAVIRRWGPRGLGGLVRGPTPETQLELLPTGATWHPQAVILRIEVDHAAWAPSWT